MESAQSLIRCLPLEGEMSVDYVNAGSMRTRIGRRNQMSDDDSILTQLKGFEPFTLAR